MAGARFESTSDGRIDSRPDLDSGANLPGRLLGRVTGVSRKAEHGGDQQCSGEDNCTQELE